MGHPTITLTTDFGLADHYVGTMKGVLASLCPAARVIDITHGVPAFSILEAAYAVSQAAEYFPRGTVHVVVVDPGVGTSRRGILVYAGGQIFIGPDNGVFTLILDRDKSARVFTLADRRLWLDEPSSTFHGRDLFAPAAAKVANGEIKPKKVGPEITDAVLLPETRPRSVGKSRWRGVVLSIDSFGNVITNFRKTTTEVQAGHFVLQAGMGRVRAMHATFGDAPEGELFVYWGSSGYLEVGMKQARAASALRIKTGAPVTLQVMERRRRV